jgi:glycolate oxidase FAD binding subunit
LPSVSEPATVAEAAEAIGGAAARGETVSIEREGGDVVLSTAKLDRILEHEAGDLTVTVEAGVRLAALNARLAASGQRLSLDPPGDPTVGAVVAGDLFGPLAHRFGRARDLLLGVTVVFADGLAASAGGKVVKNVAGYDLGKLFAGSAGRLGLIARASFRLHPAPAATRTLVAPVADPAEAGRAYRAILHSELAPSVCDLLWPGRLALVFEGSERTVDRQLSLARKLVGGDEDGDVLAEARARQTGARQAFGAAELPGVLERLPTGLVRLGPVCFAFGRGEPPPWSPLAERIRERLDPAGTLV